MYSAALNLICVVSLQVTQRLTRTLSTFNRLRSLRELFLPLAKRAVMMFSLLSSLCSVQHEYRFSLGYFLSLFRSAVGRDVEPPTEKLQYESDSDDPEGVKKESRTTVVINVADDKGTPTPAVVQGILALSVFWFLFFFCIGKAMCIYNCLFSRVCLKPGTRKPHAERRMTLKISD